MKNNCPKCGFYLISSNCPKCGYESEHIYIERYKTEQSDLELLLKDEYLKIIHNKNTKQIILLGPLYFSYYNFYITSFIFAVIELTINYITLSYINSMDIVSSVALMPLFIAFLIIQRIIYLSFYNTLLLFLAKNKLSKIKTKSNYKELIYKYEPKSILRPIIVFLTIILILLLTSIIHRIIKGNI